MFYFFEELFDEFFEFILIALLVFSCITGFFVLATNLFDSINSKYVPVTASVNYIDRESQSVNITFIADDKEYNVDLKCDVSYIKDSQTELEVFYCFYNPQEVCIENSYLKILKEKEYEKSAERQSATATQGGA